jgi:hypothetical protein
MDFSLVASALAAQTANLQTNVTTQILKNDFSAEKQAVQVLLGNPGGATQANLGAGVGGQVDVSA